MCGCLVKVNIPLNEKKQSLVIYIDKFLEMVPSNDKLTKYVCDTFSIVLPSSDNNICVSSSYGNMSNFLRWLKDILI